MYRPEYHFNVHSAFAAASREAGLLGKFAIVGANDKPPSIGADMQLECVSLKNNGNNNNSDGTSSLRSSGEGSVSSRLGIAMKEENELSQSSSKSRDQRLTKQLSEKYDSTLGDNQNTYYNTLDSPNATRLSSGGFATGGNHYRDVQTISSTEVSISGSAVSSRHSFASPSSASKSNESDVHAGSPIASLMDLASMCEQRLVKNLIFNLIYIAVI